MSNFASLIKTHPLSLAGGALAVFVGAGLGFNHIQGATAEPAAVTAPLTSVGVRAIAAKDVRVWSEFSGRMSAVDQAEIRPQVSGRLTEIRFTDGQAVKAGDVLFVIDPRTYEAAVSQANANLASARATAALAQTELDRAARLVKTQWIARSQFDQRANARTVAEANVQAAEAALEQALIDVDRAYVKAPISGRIGRPEITLGNLVQTGPGAPLLTSIISDKGIYADFEVDEQTYMKSVRARADAGGGKQVIPVELTAQGNKQLVYKGVLYSFDNQIDTGSGTIRARARFENKDGSLVPGMFVSVKLGDSVSREALLVPDRAIGTDQNKKFVYVVEDDKAAYREVSLGQQVNSERIVLGGLRAGEKVIVDGLQHVTPGAGVQIQNVVADAK